MTTISRRLQRRYYHWLINGLDKQIASACFPASPIPVLDTPCRLVPIQDINTAATAEIIRAARPEVMITSGCPILKRDIFSIPRFGTINIHWGIAPHYRGEHTIFWPLYYGDYENIGVTIHRIDDGIDTGPILAQGFPELRPSDTEATLYAKCAGLATEMLETVLTQIEKGQPLSSANSAGPGRLYKHYDRAVWHELIFRARRMLSRPLRSQRRERRVLYASNSQLTPTQTK